MKLPRSLFGNLTGWRKVVTAFIFAVGPAVYTMALIFKTGMAPNPLACLGLLFWTLGWKFYFNLQGYH